MLRRGEWNGTRVLPEWWVDLATTSSQNLNPSYGYGWWVNAGHRQWPGVPGDAFALAGYRCNRCYVVPSLDLVVARVGSGPSVWDEPALLSAVVEAVVG